MEGSEFTDSIFETSPSDVN